MRRSGLPVTLLRNSWYLETETRHAHSPSGRPTTNLAEALAGMTLRS